MTLNDDVSDDEKRRRAITEWWERKSISDFIARIRAAKGSNRDAPQG